MKLFIVDDSRSVQEGLHIIMSGIPGVTVVGYAVDEAGAIEDIDSLLPDVVILDLHLLSGSGFNVLVHIKKYHPVTKIIVLSNYATEAYVSRCLQYGADYVLDKSFQFMLIENILKQLICPAASPNGLVALRP